MNDLEEVLKLDLYEREYMFNQQSDQQSDQQTNQQLISLFNQTILNIIDGDKFALFNYIANGGKINDVCVGHHRGNGDYRIVHIIKAIVLSGNVNIMEKFLNENSEYIDYFDNEYTLLSFAIVSDKFDIANYLIKAGINVNKQGHRRKTALYYAISSGNLELFNNLISAGADPNLTYGMGYTNYLYHALDISYTANDDYINSRKKMCLKLLKLNTNIQMNKYNKEQSDLLKNLQSNLQSELMTS